MRLKGRVHPSKKKKKKRLFLVVPLAIDFHWPQSVQWNGIFFHATCNAIVQSKGPPKFSLALAADLAFFFLMGCKIAAEQIQKKWRARFQKKRPFQSLLYLPTMHGWMYR